MGWKILTTENTEDHGGARRSVNESDDETAETVFEPGRVEVHQKTDAELAHAEVGEELGFVGRKEGGDCFDFQDNGAFDHNVGAETQGDGSVLVDDGHRYLALESDAGLFQFQTEAFPVD